MLKSIGNGAELFHELIESNCYYVDKTPFIRTVFKENGADVMLFTRPGRFGKTLTLSTFYDFLSLNIKNPGDVSLQEKWFKDTKIFEDKEFCSKYMGKFPVIFITLKQIEGKDFMTSGCGVVESISVSGSAHTAADLRRRIVKYQPKCFVFDPEVDGFDGELLSSVERELLAGGYLVTVIDNREGSCNGVIPYLLEAGVSVLVLGSSGRDFGGDYIDLDGVVTVVEPGTVVAAITRLLV